MLYPWSFTYDDSYIFDGPLGAYLVNDDCYDIAMQHKYIGGMYVSKRN